MTLIFLQCSLCLGCVLAVVQHAVFSYTMLNVLSVPLVVLVPCATLHVRPHTV